LSSKKSRLDYIKPMSSITKIFKRSCVTTRGEKAHCAALHLMGERELINSIPEYKISYIIKKF